MGIIRDWANYTGGQQGVPAEASQGLSKRIAGIFQDCMARTNSNRDQALERLQQEVLYDRHFDSYDPKRLAERVNDVWQEGRSFDWDDSYLKRGGRARPT